MFELKCLNFKPKLISKLYWCYELQIKSGQAEIFGTELVKGKTYTFKGGSKIAVFTWQGCLVEIKGKTEVAYSSRETPMVIYLNTHAGLEQVSLFCIQILHFIIQD